MRTLFYEKSTSVNVILIEILFKKFIQKLLAVLELLTNTTLHITIQISLKKKKAMKRRVRCRKYYREPVIVSVYIFDVNSGLYLLRKGMWNAAEDGLGAVH